VERERKIKRSERLEQATNHKFGLSLNLTGMPIVDLQVMYLLLHEHNASVNSSCTHPPLLGNCGAIAHLVSPGGGALANLAWPGGRAVDYAGYYPWAIGT